MFRMQREVIARRVAISSKGHYWREPRIRRVGRGISGIALGDS
jgi:hypothetical protein